MSLQAIFKDRPTNIIYLLFFTIITRLPFAFDSFDVLPTNWLERIYFPYLENQSWLYVLASSLLVFLNSFLIVWLLNKFNIGRYKTYLGGILYILFTAFIGYTTIYSHALIADTIVIILLFELYKTHRRTNQFGAVFNLGFWTSILWMIHFSNGVYFIFFLIALISLRKTTLHEVILYIIGFFVPLYFMWLYLFWNGDGVELGEHLVESASFISSFKIETLVVLIHAGLLGLLVLSVFLSWAAFQRKTITQVRNFIAVIYGLLIATIVALFLFRELSYLSLAKIALPLSILTTLLFMEIKKWWIEVALFLFLIISAFFFIFNDYLSLSLLDNL